MKLSKRYLITTIHGLRPSALYGRVVGSRVLLNSIPKAGTNLLLQAFNYMPTMRGMIGRTIRGWDYATEKTISSLRSIGKGQFAAAHLPSHQDILKVVHDNNIKVVFVIRDPRDIVVSYVNYVTYIDLTHPAHNYFAELPNDDVRLMAAIEGVPEVVSPINVALDKFIGWLDPRYALTVKYEDIVGRRGGGQDNVQNQSLINIIQYLDIPITNAGIEKLRTKLYSTKTLTFNSGKIKQWKARFKTRHREIFKRLAGNQLIAYGYETDLDWN